MAVPIDQVMPVISKADFMAFTEKLDALCKGSTFTPAELQCLLFGYAMDCVRVAGLSKKQIRLVFEETLRDWAHDHAVSRNNR